MTTLPTADSDHEIFDVENSEKSQAEVGNRPQYPCGFKFALLTIGLMAVVLVLALDNYIIATATPRITTQFKDLNLVGWYGSSYFLTLMAFLPAFGQLCTLFPVKIVYLLSIVGFELGSIISASAQSSIAFIIGRLISGAAGGGLWCGTLTLMGHAVAPSKRHLYVSVVTSMYGAASAAGPLLGGVFTDSRKLTWRFCFWLNLPIGSVAFVVIAFALEAIPPPPQALSLTLPQKVARLDIPGAVLLAAALACLLLALQWGGTTYAWSNSRVWGCLLGFGLLSLAFALLQVKLGDRQVSFNTLSNDHLMKSISRATIPGRIVFKRTAAAGCAFTIFISMAIGVHVYYLPFYFQAVLGNTALQSGIRTLPYLMALLLTPMISGILITLVGYYVPFMLVGSTLITIGSGLLFTLSPHSTKGQWISYQILAAFGAGLCRQIAFSAVPLVLHEDDLATASALVAFCNSLGPTLAIGIGQSIFTTSFVQQVSSVSSIDVKEVLTIGASNLSAFVSSSQLGIVEQAFNYALTRAFILSTASAGAAFCCSAAMEWINVKKKD